MNEPIVCLGIDITSGRQPFTFAALDARRGMLASGQGTLDDVLAYCAGLNSAAAAVNAPDLAAARSASAPEVELARRGLRLPRLAPGKSVPARLQKGAALYERLAGLGYAPFTTPEVGKSWLEVNCEAVYWAWISQPALDSRTFEGRLQRTAVLYEHDLPVSDPMDFFEEITRHRMIHGKIPLERIPSGRMLNALAAAATAWCALYQPADFSWVGSPEGRRLAFPISALPNPPAPQAQPLPLFDSL